MMQWWASAYAVRFFLFYHAFLEHRKNQKVIACDADDLHKEASQTASHEILWRWHAKGLQKSYQGHSLFTRWLDQ